MDTINYEIGMRQMCAMNSVNVLPESLTVVSLAKNDTHILRDVSKFQNAFDSLKP